MTWQLPERDRISLYKDQMLTDLGAVRRSHRRGPVRQNISTGASNDFERAKIARDMVTRFTA